MMPIFTSIQLSLHTSFALIALTTLLIVVCPVLAQAPVNDVVSWPPGLLLLASILYAALGTPPEKVWEIEPVVGCFLWSGLPKISIPTMQKVAWLCGSCHFVSGIPNAFGKSNYWIRAEEVTVEARTQALEMMLKYWQCVICDDSYHPHIDPSLWKLTPHGLVAPASVPIVSSSITPSSTLPSTFISSSPSVTPSSTLPSAPISSFSFTPSFPSARDFLLFAAIDYHVFRDWEVEIITGGNVIFSTKGMPSHSIIDVDCEQMALYVVAAQFVRRPHSQSKLRNLAKHEGDDERGIYTLDLDNNQLSSEVPICKVDFHSYAPRTSNVSAPLKELAGAYYRVVQYIKCSSHNLSNPPKLVRFSDQTLWIAILGGVVLDKGRLTIQNLPGRWGGRGISADQAYLGRIETIIEEIGEHANKPSFSELVFAGGLSRRVAFPLFIAGLCGQVIVCYFLSVGTSAGVWTSVALANSVYAGRLTDWHSLYYGTTTESDEPGMKMYVPGSKEVMVIATFDRSTPKQASLRPGFLLNIFGLVAAICGAVFQDPTRDALSFGAFLPTANWIVYTSIVLCIGTTVLISICLACQQLREKTWNDNSEFPTRCMAYATLPCAALVSVLAVWFQYSGLSRFWPVLDALTWISGVPLGMIENGRMISVDENMLHLVLLNRWIMGAVASSVGSASIR